MTCSRLLPEFHRSVFIKVVLNVLFHVGGNNLGICSFGKLIRSRKFGLLHLWLMFPRVITVWSDKVPRKVWREARSVEQIIVNKQVSRFMAQ